MRAVKVLAAITLLGGMAVGIAPAQAAAPCAGTPTVVAHRGGPLTGSTGYPENTVTAVNHALSVGARVIEGDVWWTASNVPVVSHDDDVYRTTNSAAHVNISASYMSGLQALDWGEPKRLGTAFAGTPLTTLWNWLAAIHDTSGATALLELKETPNATDLDWLISRIEGTDMQGRITIYSFDAAALAPVKAARPAWKYGLVEGTTYDMARTPESVKAQAGDLYAASYYGIVPANGGTPSKVNYWKGGGLTVYGWTADTTALWTALTSAGVDGIITDDPQGYLTWAAGRCPTATPLGSKS